MTVELSASRDVDPSARIERPHHVFTLSTLTLRWVFLAAVTLIAFHRSIRSVVDSTVAGSLIGYVWLVPVAAIVAAVGISHRDRTELPIHDRQTDIIVGILGLVFGVLLQSILLQRYALYFHLLRIDLVALWFFLVASSVVLFGLRPVLRFGWAWLILLLAFPLGYHLAVIFLGGNRSSAGIASLLIAATATAVSVGRTPSRAMVGAVASMVTGTAALVVMTILTPQAPILAFQLIPAMLAMTLAGLGLYGYARRGPPQTVAGKANPATGGQAGLGGGASRWC